MTAPVAPVNIVANGMMLMTKDAVPIVRHVFVEGTMNIHIAQDATHGLKMTMPVAVLNVQLGSVVNRLTARIVLHARYAVAVNPRRMLFKTIPVVIIRRPTPPNIPSRHRICTSA